MPRLTQPYKNTSAHRQRVLSTEAQFKSGVKYTNAPLEDGYARALVNFKLHNDGESLTPRGGRTLINSTVYNNSAEEDTVQVVYYSGNCFVQNSAGTDVSTHHVTIVGTLTADGLDCEEAYAIIENMYGVMVSSQLTGTSSTSLKMSPAAVSAHGMLYQNTDVRKAVCTELNGNLYSMLASDKFVVNKFKWTDLTQTSFTWTVEEVTPKEPNPSLTINYGYNMLKAAPYSFSNELVNFGDVAAIGLVPYTNTATPKLLLNARSGEEIYFKLVYRYPQVDVTNSETYRVQWEIQDNDAGTDAVIIQKWDKSPVYNPNDEIGILCRPTMTNFSLICKIYKTSSIVDQQDEWEANENLQTVCSEEDFITPESVTVLASYYITNESATTAKNVEPNTYNITTANGMCMWNQRLVLWGVYNAETVLWVSEINDPSYFPYPNNIELFNEDIIACVPYLTDLLVFTRTSLYRLVLNDDGLTYTTNKIQDNLNISADDAGTVLSIQNLIVFRSGNYYYMVTPNYSFNTGKYSVKLAPISRPMEYFFDNFEEASLNIINSVYGLSPDLHHYPLQLLLNSNRVYVDGNEIHNVFCMTVRSKNTTSSVYADLCTVNLHIVYDSVLRCWFFELEQGDKCMPYMHRNTATGDTELCKVYISDTNSCALDIYKYDKEHLADTLRCTGSAIKYNNRQYLDTGNRNFAEDLKKRFREIQFCVNILERAQLKFNTGFIVDDVPEVLPYKWNVEVIDEDTGTLGVSREYLESDCTPMHTMLDTWKIDENTFPDTTVFKIRYHICGKGYNGSAQILSDNQFKYELLHIGFVYRQMFAR